MRRIAAGLNGCKGCSDEEALTSFPTAAAGPDTPQRSPRVREGGGGVEGGGWGIARIAGMQGFARHPPIQWGSSLRQPVAPTPWRGRPASASSSPRPGPPSPLCTFPLLYTYKHLTECDHFLRTLKNITIFPRHEASQFKRIYKFLERNIFLRVFCQIIPLQKKYPTNWSHHPPYLVHPGPHQICPHHRHSLSTTQSQTYAFQSYHYANPRGSYPMV